MKHNYLKHLFTALLLLCATVATAHDIEVGGIFYNITSSANKTVVVTYKGSSYSQYSNEYTGSVVIPESITYNDITYSVISIGERAFYGCSGLTSIVIPNSVTNIGEYAFSGTAWYNNQPNGIVYAGNVLYKYKGAMPVNTSIVIKDGTKAIANDAFSYCSGLTSIEIPGSVTSIGYSAFWGCSGLTSIIIPNSVTNIGRSAFLGCTGLTSIIIPNSVTSIGSQAFSDCSDLKSVEFNAVNCTTMGNLNSPVFNGCTALSTVTIGENVKNIPEAAFVDCSGLKSIEISNSVTSIGYSAFWGCSGLTSVVIPNSVTSIGDYAFYDCTRLTSVTSNATIAPSLGCDPFSNISLTAVLYYPAGSDYSSWNSYFASTETLSPNIGGSCGANVNWTLKDDVLTISGSGPMDDFTLSLPWVKYRSYIKAVIIEEAVTSISDYAFEGCSNLTNVEISNSVASIGKSAFRECGALTSVVIGNSVTSIGDYAFIYCSALTNIEIPNSIKSIGRYAFEGCTSLTSIEIPNSVISFANGVFYNCTGLRSVVIGNGITNIDYEVFSGCTSLKNLRIEDSENQLTFNSTTPYLETLYLGREISSNLYPFCKNKNLTSLTIGGCVTKIGKQAFLGCSGLTSIVIPNSVTSVEEYAFVDCTSLTSIEIPNSITKIGYGAFLGCALKEVYISDLAAWCDIDFESSFCDYAENLYLNGELLTELVIPNEVAEIKKYAFWGCSGLTSVTIPNSVTSVGEYAFYGCSGLTSITSLIPADAMFAVNTNTFNKVDKNVCTLYVPYGAKEAYASTAGWSEFANIVELEQPTINVSINQYGSATCCYQYALDFSNVEGLKAYSAIGFNSSTQVVTLARVMTTPAEAGIFVKGEPGEYKVPIIEECNDHTLNLLVGTLEQTTVNSTDGAMSNYKFTIADGDEAPMFYPFEDGTTLSAGKAYLQIPTAWLPATAQKSVGVRFDEGETTDIDEVKGENGELKGVCFDLQGRVVENPASGIYIIDGKKVIIK